MLLSNIASAALWVGLNDGMNIEGFENLGNSYFPFVPKISNFYIIVLSSHNNLPTTEDSLGARQRFQEFSPL